MARGFLFVVLNISFLLLSPAAEVFGIENRTFDGKIDFLNKGISFNLDLKDGGKLEASAGLQDNKYTIKLVLRHIKFGKSDILTEFYASGTILRGRGGRPEAVRGKAWTQASLLNFKPLKEFFAEYELNDSEFILNSLSWADMDINGRVKKGKGGAIFDAPEFDIILTINQKNLGELAGLLGINPQDVFLAGNVSGEVRVRGPKDAVRIDARLVASEGEVALIKFSSAKFDLEGIWPVLRFVSAQINDVGGIVYELKGQFNLKELSDFGSSEHKVAVYSANNAMRLQDWVIRRQADEKGQDTVEAEYPLKKNQALKMRIKNQEETLGWEKSVKF